MSYILDALKKAEAERKLGAVPGIHAPATDAAGRDHRPARMLWRAGGLALLAAVLAALTWFRPWHAPQTAALPRMPEPTKLPPAPPPASTTPAPQPVPAPVLPLVQLPQLKPTAVARSVPPPLPAKPRAIASAAPPPAAPPQTQAAQAADTQDNAPLALRELPEQIQRELPVLKIGGYIYSSNPAERSLLINNKLLREGDEAAPGLMLEKMLRGSVVLNYKGYRYRIAY